MHLNTELLDDVIKVIIIGTSSAAAWFGAKNHAKIKHVDEAVNGVKSPDEPTLRETVVEIRDEQKDVKAKLGASPPPGQVG